MKTFITKEILFIPYSSDFQPFWAHGILTRREKLSRHTKVSSEGSHSLMALSNKSFFLKLQQHTCGPFVATSTGHSSVAENLIDFIDLHRTQDVRLDMQGSFVNCNNIRAYYSFVLFLVVWPDFYGTFIYTNIGWSNNSSAIFFQNTERPLVFFKLIYSSSSWIVVLLVSFGIS